MYRTPSVTVRNIGIAVLLSSALGGQPNGGSRTANKRPRILGCAALACILRESLTRAPERLGQRRRFALATLPHQHKTPCGHPIAPASLVKHAFSRSSVASPTRPARRGLTPARIPATPAPPAISVAQGSLSLPLSSHQFVMHRAPAERSGSERRVLHCHQAPPFITRGRNVPRLCVTSRLSSFAIFVSHRRLQPLETDMFDECQTTVRP